MSNIYDVVDASTLDARCKVDLLDAVAQLGLHSQTLPKKAATIADAPLPSCTCNSTVCHSLRCEGSFRQSSLNEYVEKRRGSHWEMAKTLGSTYFKSHKPKFRGAPRTTDPFRDARDRTHLSWKEKDFVHRYAEAKMKKSIPREEEESTAKKVAVDAYKEAFRKLKGRDPTGKELEEVDRLYFAYADDGRVGVVQKPHYYGPHMHVSICNRRHVCCPNQIYKAGLPPVRGARNRFPGPIPVWTSTKNIHTMASGDTYTPGLHNVSKFGEASQV
uniref:Uncharacterized protein n=1 Tax=Trypanosoma congolense (strain IL3000) TaxID=1068625 RepID=G0V0B9_TRYCI|nr:conserved hypothetical protein [Trypanosoma congolense IL3000]